MYSLPTGAAQRRLTRLFRAIRRSALFRSTRPRPFNGEGAHPGPGFLEEI